MKKAFMVVSVAMCTLMFGTLMAWSEGTQVKSNSSSEMTRTGPLPTNGNWTIFVWSNGPDVWNYEGPFTFSGIGVLDVTDAFVDGDQFEVYDNGVLIGTTSVPVDDGAYEYDPNTTFTDSRWSSGSFSIGQGDHSITIRIISIAMGHPDGGAYLRFAAYKQVPTLSHFGMIGLGILMLISASAILKRRQNQTN